SGLIRAPAWLAAPCAIVSVIARPLRAVLRGPDRCPRAAPARALSWLPMLRRRATLNAMPPNDIADRLLVARSRLDGLRGAVEARTSWPASDNFGAEPEASWYPPELLAHVAEMVPYWMAQI